MIHIQPAVKQETAKIAIGVAALTAVMLLVFLLLGYFDVQAVLGAILGAAAAVGNFFLMAMGVQRATEKINGVEAAADPETADPETADPESESEKQLAQRKKSAKHGMQLSYYGRMLLVVAVAALAIYVPCFNPAAALFPLLFPHLVVFINQFIQDRKGEKS